MTNSTISSGGTISSSSLMASGSQISSADGISLSGNLTAKEGTTIRGGVANAQNVTVTDSSIFGSTSMSGDLVVINGSIEDVMGAENASVSNSTTGSLSRRRHAGRDK